ncbi:hypothetical protein FRC12_008423 [Ceratobasidium sp. 428]|nr:hypothetical protein FRC12_008423 [Ceratobasidium sp. 428]
MLWIDEMEADLDTVIVSMQLFNLIPFTLEDLFLTPSCTAQELVIIDQAYRCYKSERELTLVKSGTSLFLTPRKVCSHFGNGFGTSPACFGPRVVSCIRITGCLTL